MANFPVQRLRRLRANATLRRMVRETHVSPSDLIAPLFMESGEGVRTPIASLPGQHRFSPDTAAQQARRIVAARNSRRHLVRHSARRRKDR
jgi:porphobilinogen synthase